MRFYLYSSIFNAKPFCEKHIKNALNVRIYKKTGLLKKDNIKNLVKGYFVCEYLIYIKWHIYWGTRRYWLWDTLI